MDYRPAVGVVLAQPPWPQFNGKRECVEGIPITGADEVWRQFHPAMMMRGRGPNMGGEQGDGRPPGSDGGRAGGGGDRPWPDGVKGREKLLRFGGQDRLHATRSIAPTLARRSSRSCLRSTRLGSAWRLRRMTTQLLAPSPFRTSSSTASRRAAASCSSIRREPPPRSPPTPTPAAASAQTEPDHASTAGASPRTPSAPRSASGFPQAFPTSWCSPPRPIPTPLPHRSGRWTISRSSVGTATVFFDLPFEFLVEPPLRRPPRLWACMWRTVSQRFLRQLRRLFGRVPDQSTATVASRTVYRNASRSDRVYRHLDGRRLVVCDRRRHLVRSHGGPIPSCCQSGRTGCVAGQLLVDLHGV